MRRILPLILWQFGLLAGGRLLADVITPKDGPQISGSVESGNIQELHVKVGDRSLTVDIHQVQAIQFGAASPAAPPPSKVADPPSGSTLADALILKDGTRVTGRWWSIDASNIHLLVNNQLQHYPRPDVFAVTFGGATLPPAAPSTPPPATPTQPPASVAQAAPAPAASPHSLTQPEQLGMVYFWNGKVLTPLERNQAVERKSGSSQYWEMPLPESHLRLKEAPRLVFILRLPKGVDPASYGLFLLVTANGKRRTRPPAGSRGGLVTWPVDIEKNDESSLITYALTVRDLPTGEYSFSPSSSNDGYCFGVDPAAPGQ